MEQSIASDGQVVIAARDGSDSAFALLVEQYHRGIHSYLTARVENREVAEDLTQDTFLAAYRSLYQLDDALSFQAWLYRIAHNCAISHLRRRALRSFVSLDSLAERIGGWVGRPSSPQPEDIVGRDLIDATLAQLSDAERDALLLHSLAGLTTVEVAEVLGIGVHAAGRRISRAKEHFRVLYRALSDGDPDDQGARRRND